MDTNVLKQIEKLKRELRESNEKRIRYKAEQDALMKRLSEEFNCESIKEAKELLKSLQIGYNTLNDKIKQQLEDIENELR